MVNIWAAGVTPRPMLSIRIPQWRRLGKLGKCLGHLERHHSPGRGAARRVATIERGVRHSLPAPDGSPIYPTLSYGVFASRWPLTATAMDHGQPDDYDRMASSCSVLEKAHIFRPISWSGADTARRAELRFLPSPSRPKATAPSCVKDQLAGRQIAALMTRMRAMTARPFASYRTSGASHRRNWWP